MPMDWFRWHHGSVNDPKFQLVAKKAGASVGEVIGVWACLLEAASAATDRGNPGLPDFEAMDCALGYEDGKSRRIFEHMRVHALLDPETGRISAWERRQPKREREDDNSTERSRAHRAMQRQATPSNAAPEHETPRDTIASQETPRGEEIREDSPSLRSGEGAGKPARATPKCPAAFEVTAELREWAAAKCPGVDLAGETEKFRDHTFKTAHSDWAGAWRNWVRRTFERGDGKKGAKSFQQADIEAKQARVREMTGGILGNGSSRPQTIDMEEANGALAAIR